HQFTSKHQLSCPNSLSPLCYFAASKAFLVLPAALAVPPAIDMSNNSGPPSEISFPEPSTAAHGDSTKNLDLALEPGAVYVALFRLSLKKNYHWPSLSQATREPE